MIPMRDGARLETNIFSPKNASKPLPFLFVRTPYGIPEDEGFLAPHGPHAALIEEGYIWVLQNVRGRLKSEGSFVMMRPPRAKGDPKAIDESTDAFDTIEWLLKNVPNNSGRAGMLGGSYDAWTAVMASLDPHPALKAIIEEASPADMFIGDDFHHNGAFRLSYGFEYAAFLETDTTKNTHFKFGRLDTFDWYLDLGPLSNANARHFHGKIPTWNDFVAHPNRDAFWEKQAVAEHHTDATVPTLNVAGWWDQEDLYGPQKIYETLERTDKDSQNYIVIGPWNHGGWGDTGRRLGPIDFGSDTGTHYRRTIAAPWLAHFLHEKGKLERPEATVFETGSNRWRTFEKWPPEAGVTNKRLYFRAGRALSFEPPRDAGSAAADSYISDPASPVPYVRRPIAPTYQGSEWPVWLVQDQRFVDRRPDVLSFQTEVLDADVTVAGSIVAELYAATSGTDSDWIVKLIDVYPEGDPPAPPKDAPEGSPAPPDLRGYQLMIANEVLRGRFRDSFAKPEPIPRDKIVKYAIDLHTSSHVFRKGHRIMVQVQSTWFPLIDRNPQRYVENIFLATEADFVKATQRIARSREAPSAIVLPVLASSP
jgi:putative CocE/NonD family hydrolase